MSKDKANSFDTEADFIPFDVSDEEPEEEPTAKPNGESKKRKRALDSSPERGQPLKTKKRTGKEEVNPWQKSIDDYAFSSEPSRMYFLFYLI